MSGHSKWSTIKRKKAAVDAKRSQQWTKLIKEIQVAARMGGGDPAGNPRLRLAIDRARSANVPKANIERAIEKGTGGGGEAFEEVVYEGYAPAGVAIVVECMTDNRNRTVGEVRHIFDKHGGNLGASGSVSWMFKKRGLINVLQSAASEDRIMEVALEAGAEDVRDDGEVWTVDTDPSQFLAVKEAIEAAGIPIEHAEVDNVPDTRVTLTDPDTASSVLKLIGALEDLDDVQNVYANYDIDDELADRVSA
ncbi:MAG: YebC/PmpR family DNA-binding transcriptional regulator [Deltaproteobacteria bacterium]|nr:MAG: YebC/PmpR family DNA-binding transcriptional regulator [Deltaproteobacteria bacterium]